MLNPLFQDIAKELSHTWEKPVIIKGSELIARRISCTSRLLLEKGDRIPGSAIVKHIPIEDYPGQAWNLELQHESDLYQFLDSLHPTFQRKAKYYGSSQKGYLILEDLGKSSFIWSQEKASKALAKSFAELHATTWGKEEDWKNFQQKTGWKKEHLENKENSKTFFLKCFGRGIQQILKDISPEETSRIKKMQQEAEQIFSTIQDGGKWTALVHHDLLNHRQCIPQGEDLYLIDFENMIFAHALLDLAKSIVGKFEYNLEVPREYQDYLFYMNPQFPQEIIQDYRYFLEFNHSLVFEEEEFQEEMETALLFSGIALFGEFLELEEKEQIYGTRQNNLNWIFTKTTQFLDKPDRFPEITKLLKEYTFII